ncbi:MAG: ATP-grasp domain-containing protein [Polyangiales bacterium]
MVDLGTAVSADSPPSPRAPGFIKPAAEARCFVRDGRVLACSVYEGAAEPEAAAAFAGALCAGLRGPEVYVVDVGLIPGRGWAVVEFNAAWGAGLNGCDPELVLPAIAAASGVGADTARLR